MSYEQMIKIVDGVRRPTPEAEDRLSKMTMANATLVINRGRPECLSPDEKLCRETITKELQRNMAKLDLDKSIGIMSAFFLEDPTVNKRKSVKEYIDEFASAGYKTIIIVPEDKSLQYMLIHESVRRSDAIDIAKDGKNILWKGAWEGGNKSVLVPLALLAGAALVAYWACTRKQ